jgi:hypothetical protein
VPLHFDFTIPVTAGQKIAGNMKEKVNSSQMIITVLPSSQMIITVLPSSQIIPPMLSSS